VNLYAVRLVLACVWLGLAAYAMAAGPLPGPFGPYAVWFALVLGLYNLMRWQMGRAVQPPAAPRHRRRRDHDRPPRDPDEYHPEFDFKKDG
jgi:hypothetical protein